MERVKKIFRLIVCIVAVLCLIGCKWAESEPVNPKIIGTAHIQSEKGLLFVEVDSVRYAADKVYIGRRDGRSGEDITVDAVAGMLVTVFKADNSEKAQFVTGTKNAEEIEAMFHRNRSFLFVFAVMIIGCVIMLVVSASEQQKNKEKIPIAHADSED